MTTEFRFKVGDLVTHKLDPRVRGLVLERHTLESTAGVERRYLVRTSPYEAPDEGGVGTIKVLEFELDAAPEPRR